MTPRRALCVVCLERPEERAYEKLCAECNESWVKTQNTRDTMPWNWAARRARAFERKRQKKARKA